MLDRLMGVGGERAARFAELPVEVDRCAERKDARCDAGEEAGRGAGEVVLESKLALERLHDRLDPLADEAEDRKSTRLNSSHGYISYAVFCLKKKKNKYAKDR